MKLVYIAGKYRDKNLWGVTQNIREAERVMVAYLKMGFAVICPHKNTAYLDGSCGDGDDHIYLDMDLEMLGRCDIIVMLTNWERSEGAKKELEYARAHGLKVVFDHGD